MYRSLSTFHAETDARGLFDSLANRRRGEPIPIVVTLCYFLCCYLFSIFLSFTSLFLIRLPFCCMMRTREEVIRLLTLPTVLWSPLSVRIFDSSYHSTCRLQLLRCYAYMQAIMRGSVYFECRIERTS